MRNCLFRYWCTVERRFIASPIPGVFHQWGSEATEVGDTIAAYTVGIVEDKETGHVYKVEVSEIQFIDEQALSEVHKMD